MIYIIGSIKYNTKPQFNMLPISGHPITWQNSPVRISKTNERKKIKSFLLFSSSYHLTIYKFEKISTTEGNAGNTPVIKLH